MEVVLFGDFNLPSLRWDRRNYLESAVYKVDVDFFKMFLNLGLVEPINVSTIFLSCIIIDMCLCLHANRAGFCEFKVPFLISIMLWCSLIKFSRTLISTILVHQKIVKSYGAIAFWSNMNDTLSEIVWESELEFLDATPQYDRFIANNNPLSDRFAPVKTGLSNDFLWALINHRPW